MRKLVVLLVPFMLTGCVKDSDTYYINGRDHSITVRVEQSYFWEKTGELSLIANRLPECQRRSALGPVDLQTVEFDLYQADETTYVLRGAEQEWAVSSDSCELLDAVPAGGTKLGTFSLAGEDLKFEAEQPAAAAGAEQPAQ